MYINYMIQTMQQINPYTPCSNITPLFPAFLPFQMKISITVKEFPLFHETRPKHPPNTWNLRENILENDSCNIN